MTTNVGNSSGRKRGVSLLIVVAVALTAVVAVGVGVEFYARNKAASCMSQSLEQDLGGPVDVSFGAKPLLLTVLDHKVSSVNISAPDANISGLGSAALKGIDLDASFDDVRLPADANENGSIGSSSANIVWPADAILASLQTLPIGGVITGVELDAAANTMHVQALGGLGSLTLRPSIENGAITMTTVSVTALGIGLPNDFAQQIIDVITGELAAYPLGLAPESIAVTDTGLRIQLRGGQTELVADSTATTSSSCSFF